MDETEAVKWFFSLGTASAFFYGIFAFVLAPVGGRNVTQTAPYQMIETIYTPLVAIVIVAVLFGGYLVYKFGIDEFI